MPKRSRRPVGGAVAFVAILAACGSPPRAPSKDVVLEGPKGDGIRIREFDGAHVAPETVHLKNERLFAWAMPDREKKVWNVEARKLVDGAKAAEPIYFLSRGEEVNEIVTRAVRDHFVVAWTTGSGTRTRIGVSHAHEDDGVYVAAPRKDVLWMDVVPSVDGEILVWAERSEDESAELRALRINSKLEALSAPTPLAVGSIAWQVAEVEGGLGLLTIDRGKVLTELHYRTFSDALALKSDRALAKEVGAEIDLHVSNLGTEIAWTDLSDLDPHARKSTTENVRETPAVQKNARSIVAFAGKGLLLRSEEPGEGKCLRVLESGGALESPPLCFLESPEISTRGDAVFLEGVLRACDQKGACTPSTAIVSIGEQPGKMRVTPLQAIDSAWGLDCSGPRCLTLMSKTQGSGQVVEWGSPPIGEKIEEAAFTKIEAATETVARARSIQAIAGDLVQPPAKTAEPWIALLEGESNASASVFLTRGGRTDERRQLVTIRARATGGVAVSGGGHGGIVAWVGSDGIHLSGIDASGKRESESRLGGDEGSRNVSLVRVSDGWWLGYIDGKGNVTTRKIGNDMRAVGPEVHFSDATKDALEFALVPSADHRSIIAAWAATEKNAPRATDYDVYSCFISQKTGRCEAKEAPIERTAAPASRLSVAPYRDGAVVAWIDGKSSEERPTVTLARISPTTAPKIERLGGSELYTGVIVEAARDESQARSGVILSIATPSGVRLSRASFDGSTLSATSPVGWLSGPMSQSLMGSFFSPLGFLYYEAGETTLDSATKERGRLRRAFLVP